MIDVYLSIGLITILFTLEYYLRQLSIKSYYIKYVEHVKIIGYPTELKPSNKRSKIRYFIFIGIVAIISTLILKLDISIFIKRSFLGFMLMSISSALGLYISNLLSYDYVIKNLETISGQVNMSPKLTLKMYANTLMYTLIPFTICAFYIQDPFIYGSIFGLINLYYIINKVHNKIS